MRYFIFLIYSGIILLYPDPVYSQNTLSGNIKTEKGVPIGNVNVILVNRTADTIILFTSTDLNGNFAINYNNTVDSLRLDLSCIGYEKREIFLLKSDKQNLVLQLKTLIEELEEVVIEDTRPISKRGDTINYNVNSFADKTDRVIIDVIRNLPGIRVTENGQILYQNKTINKFYVDGKDLLEDRYSIASNNLPVNSVEYIQLLENHQPIKLLENIEQSDRAAINIKLNKYSKMRLLGNGNLGLGLTPFLRDNNIALLKFNKSEQYINTLKNNNIGINLDNEITEQNFSPNLVESSSIKRDLLNLVTTTPPPIDATRYRFNDNTLINSNYLIGLNKLLDLKFNIAYENDNITHKDEEITKIYLPTDTIVINESHRGESSYHKLLSGLSLNANSKKIYLKNTLKFQRIWSNERDFISSVDINQTLRNPFINLINDLNGIVNIKNNLLGIKSFTSYTNLPQRLNITPGHYNNLFNDGKSFDENLQIAHFKEFFSNNSVSYGKKLSTLNFNNKIGLLLKFQKLSNDLNFIKNEFTFPAIGDFKNTIDRNLLKIYDEASLSFSDNMFSGQLSLNINFNKLSNNGRNITQTADELFINPNLSLRYIINVFWDTNLSFYTNNNANYQANPSYILQNYRSLINSDVPLYKTNSKNINYALNYKNVINAIFANFSIRYSNTSNNILLATKFDQSLITQKAILQKNPSTNLSVIASINKYYLALKTNIDFSLNYDINTSRLMQQDALTDIESKIIGFGTKINTRMNKAFSLTHTLDLTRYNNVGKQGSLQTIYDPISFLNQNFALNIFMPKDYTAKLIFEHYYNNVNNLDPVNYYFVDAMLQKKILKPKLDFSVTLANIFDVKSYTSYSYSNNYLINSNYSLRGSMLMFKVGFQF